MLSSEVREKCLLQTSTHTFITTVVDFSKTRRVRTRRGLSKRRSQPKKIENYRLINSCLNSNKPHLIQPIHRKKVQGLYRAAQR